MTIDRKAAGWKRPASGIGFVWERGCAVGGQRDQGVARGRGRPPSKGNPADWVRSGNGDVPLVGSATRGSRADEGVRPPRGIRLIGFVWYFLRFFFLEFGGVGEVVWNQRKRGSIKF